MDNDLVLALCSPISMEVQSDFFLSPLKLEKGGFDVNRKRIEDKTKNPITFQKEVLSGNLIKHIKLFTI